MNRRRRLLPFRELSARLGDDFVLLVGSAVPGVGAPSGSSLPMVTNIISEILAFVGRAAGHGYQEALVAGYADSLIKGRHDGLRSLMKFEEFMGRLEVASSETARHDLVEALFRCSADSFGRNQGGIARLLTSRRALACLTTNFDNTIEMALPGLDVCIYPEQPSRLPNPTEPPLLAKLHGDAARRNSVAIASALARDARGRAHEYLGRLLHGRRVLVLGYSGTGDVDIAPELQRTNAEFFWCTRTGPRDVPPWAHYAVPCDLAAWDNVGASGQRNALFELCGDVAAPSNGHDWRSLLDEWLKGVDLDHRALVVGFFGWRRALPVVHLELAAPVPSPAGTVALGWASIQAKAYRSSLKLFARALKEVPPTDVTNRRRVLSGIGFSLWRLGRLEMSRRYLKRAIRIGDPGDVRRVYLEVCRDILERLLIRDRKMAGGTWALSDVMEAVRSTNVESAAGRILEELVLLDIERLLGGAVTAREYERLFDEAMATYYYEAAAACAGAWVKVELFSGLRAMARVAVWILRARHWNYLRKLFGYAIDALVVRVVPRPGWSAGGGRQWAAIRTLPFDFRYWILAWRVPRWARAWRAGVRPRLV